MQTVYRRLRSVGFRKRASCAPLLSANHKKSREGWAMRKCAWRQTWRKIIFSDESLFRVQTNEQRQARARTCRRETGQRMVENNCKASVQAMGRSVHVWGAIWFGGRSKLTILRSCVNGKTYIDVLKRFFDDDETPVNHLFKDDNAPILIGLVKCNSIVLPTTSEESIGLQDLPILIPQSICGIL